MERLPRTNKLTAEANIGQRQANTMGRDIRNVKTPITTTVKLRR